MNYSRFALTNKLAVKDFETMIAMEQDAIDRCKTIYGDCQDQHILHTEKLKEMGDWDQLCPLSNERGMMRLQKRRIARLESKLRTYKDSLNYREGRKRQLQEELSRKTQRMTGDAIILYTFHDEIIKKNDCIEFQAVDCDGYTILHIQLATCKIRVGVDSGPALIELAKEINAIEADPERDFRTDLRPDGGDRWIFVNPNGTPERMG